MNIIIQSLGFKASEELEEFIREKLNSLNNDRIIKASVVIYKGPDTEPGNNYCEIRLDMPGNDPFVKRNNEQFETAINQCIEVLKDILQQQKVKQTHARQANAEKIQDAINEAGTDQGADLEDVVK